MILRRKWRSMCPLNFATCRRPGNQFRTHSAGTDPAARSGASGTPFAGIRRASGNRPHRGPCGRANLRFDGAADPQALRVGRCSSGSQASFTSPSIPEWRAQCQSMPRVLGNFVPGYSISEISVDPPSTTIIGPRSRVETVENAITDPVDVSGLMERGTFVTHAYVPDPLIQVVDPASIRVTVIMQKNAPQLRQNKLTEKNDLSNATTLWYRWNSWRCRRISLDPGKHLFDWPRAGS